MSHPCLWYLPFGRGRRTQDWFHALGEFQIIPSQAPHGIGLCSFKEFSLICKTFNTVGHLSKIWSSEATTNRLTHPQDSNSWCVLETLNGFFGFYEIGNPCGCACSLCSCSYACHDGPTTWSETGNVSGGSICLGRVSRYGNDGGSYSLGAASGGTAHGHTWSGFHSDNVKTLCDNEGESGTWNDTRTCCWTKTTMKTCTAPFGGRGLRPRRGCPGCWRSGSDCELVISDQRWHWSRRSGEHEPCQKAGPLPWPWFYAFHKLKWQGNCFTRLVIF